MWGGISLWEFKKAHSKAGRTTNRLAKCQLDICCRTVWEDEMKSFDKTVYVGGFNRKRDGSWKLEHFFGLWTVQIIVIDACLACL